MHTLVRYSRKQCYRPSTRSRETSNERSSEEIFRSAGERSSQRGNSASTILVIEVKSETANLAAEMLLLNLMKSHAFLHQVSTHPWLHILPKGNSKCCTSTRKGNHSSGEALARAFVLGLKVFYILGGKDIVIIAGVEALTDDVGLRLEKAVMKMSTRSLLAGHGLVATLDQ
jgi:hypothetical protein